jgi:hypothetical protein
MEQGQQKAAVVLKYAKRRFDGGNEMDLINVIERQQDVDQLNKLYQPRSVEGKHASFTAPLSLMPNAVVAQPAVEQDKTARVRYSKLGEIALRGPLQICIGLVGILTAGLAIMTFRRHRNDVMLAQSRLVLNECLKSLRKGCWDTLVSPVKVLKTILTKA